MQDSSSTPNPDAAPHPGNAPRTVIITGASNGIGRATAQRLARDGFHILNIDREAPEHLLAQETYVPIDLADTQALQDGLAQLTAEHHIVHLVNNAAIVRPEMLEDTTVEDMRAVMRVDVEAPLLITQAVLPAMRAAGYGRIVNICSRVTLGKQKRTAYSAAKAGLLGMTKTWALELADQGITVNAIGPGPIGTALFHRVNPAGSPQTAKILRDIPVHRVGQPEEIAHTVAYFMHELGGFTTGQILYVCGGLTVGMANA